MKLEIYKEAEQDKKVRFRLVEESDEIRLVAVDENGEKLEEGNLVTFDSNGGLWLNPGINKSLGFKLDSEGRLIVHKC